MADERARGGAYRHTQALLDSELGGWRVGGGRLGRALQRLSLAAGLHGHQDGDGGGAVEQLGEDLRHLLLRRIRLRLLELHCTIVPLRLALGAAGPTLKGSLGRARLTSLGRFIDFPIVVCTNWGGQDWIGKGTLFQPGITFPS